MGGGHECARVSGVERDEKVKEVLGYLYWQLGVWKLGVEGGI